MPRKVGGERPVGGVGEPLGQPERGEAADHRPDAEPDRERARREAALVQRVPVDVLVELPATGRARRRAG